MIHSSEMPLYQSSAALAPAEAETLEITGEAARISIGDRILWDKGGDKTAAEALVNQPDYGPNDSVQASHMTNLWTYRFTQEGESKKNWIKS